MTDIKKYKNILVFVEQREGKIQNVSLELISKAKELSEKNKQQVYTFIPGYKIDETHAKECFRYGADKCFITNDELLKNYTTETYTKVVTNFIDKFKPEAVLFGATTIGRDLAPRVSARIHTGLTADCTSLDIDIESGNLLMTRPAFGGNILATIICPNHRPQMSTVRPGVMTKTIVKETKTIKIEYLNSSLTKDDVNIEILETVKTQSEKKNIEDANILISGGRGLGKKENIELLNNLAIQIGGMLSGSRAIVDNGWIESNYQVGQTGKTVRPEVYFACGISGAIQHIAGMEESELIIAINKNPEAPIFEVSDLGIVGDLNQILPLLTEELKTLKLKKEA
ncbi:MAG: electron transfer flavoprotein subunit alpha/FixB family protein [Candidatus Cloacimonetes bacterium]|jgi:electron transfer flavoprotein alpha subunit|nr:electron transfer flavoprotein subunit alpha/FixB family protein [Candidatus Cloacimonadota bacterium]